MVQIRSGIDFCWSCFFGHRTSSASHSRHPGCSCNGIGYDANYSATACETIVFKLMESASLRWRALNGAKLVADVIAGVRFIDGVKEHAA